MAQSNSLPLPGTRSRGLGSTDLMMLGMVIIWGINYSVIKIALRSLSPFAFNVLRFSLATGLMVLLLRARGESLRIRRRDLPAMILLALTGHGLYQLFFISGLARTTAGNSSMILASMPIFVALYSHVLHVERANRTTWAGILLSFGGILLLMLGSGKELAIGGSTLAGDLMTLVSAMLWAAYVMVGKPLLTRYSPVKVTTMLMLLGTPVLIAAGLPSMLSQDWGAVAPTAWAGIAYSAIMATVVGYTLWSLGLKRAGTVRTAIYSNVTPIAGVVAAWFLLGEGFQPAQVIGAAVVIAGLLLTRRGRSLGAETPRETVMSVAAEQA